MPAFRLLAAGQFTSTIGDFCYAVALPWLVLSNHGSAAELGAVLACYGLPRAALTVPGGSLTDRIGPRLVMLGSDAVRCALTAVFALLAVGHVTSLAALGPVAAVLGGCSALFLPASAALMPTLLDVGRLPAANAVYTGAVQLGSLLGPVIGGVVVAATGPPVAFCADAATYAVSAASLALMATAGRRQAAPGGTAPGAETARADTARADTPRADTDSNDAELAGLEPTEAKPGSMVSLVGETEPVAEPASVWGLLRQARILQIILMVSVTGNFALTGTTEVALPSLAHARFGADGYGAVLTCVAIGSLAGTLIVARLSRRTRPAALIGAAFLVAAAAIGLAPFLGGLPGAAGAMLVFGLALGFDNVLAVTMLQQWAPPSMLGRVMGLVMLASVGTFPLSAAAAGLVTRHLGPSPVFPISGALLAAAILAGLSQHEFRDFGAAVQPEAPQTLSPDPAAS